MKPTTDPQNITHSPEPWEAWFNYDKDGFIIAAGVDSGPDRAVGVCEVLCENVEYDDPKLFNALVIADTRVIEAAPKMLRALRALKAFTERHGDEKARDYSLVCLQAADAIAAALPKTADTKNERPSCEES